MKRRIFSLLITLVVAVSVVIGVSLTANAADEPKDVIVKSSISVAENVTLIMEVAVAEPAEDAVATIKLPDGTTTTVPLAEAEMSSGNYLFFAEVAIKDVANDVTITIPKKDGSNLVVTTTALAYCDQYLADTKQTEFNGLVEALKAYGDAADYYFDDNKTADSAPVADFSGVADAQKGGTLPDGIKHRSVTLFLESETTIRHYFELAEGKYIENYTFFVDLDKDDKCDVDEKLTPQKKVNDNGTVVYYVEIQNLAPNMLDTVYRIGVTGKADGLTYTYDYGALTYAKRSYAKGDNETKNLTAAILNYNKAASELKGTITFNNGSTVTEGEYEYGVAKPIAAPTKAGDVFLGWEDENGNVVTTIPANKTGDIKLTAKWAGTKTLYDASKQKDVTRSYCNNHSAATDTNNDGICDNCKYCVDNDSCTLGNASATAECTKCGNAHLEKEGFYSFAGLGTSASDKGHGYAQKITDSSGKEVMMFGVFNDIKNNGNFVGASGETLSGLAGKIFAVTVEVGLPTEEQYSKVEVAPSNDLGDQVGTFNFRISGSGGTDNVFSVSGGKAYISGVDSKYVTLPRGEVTKLTIVFDFTGAIAGDDAADSYTVALYDEDGTLVNKANPTLKNGDISKYSTSYLFQFRTSSKGRFLLGDIDVISANPFVNYVINAEDDANLCNYTPGTATKLPTPTKDGFEFAGWYADEALTQPIDEVPANAVGEFKVYAKWAGTKNVYDASKQSDVTRSYCYNHSLATDTDNNGKCDNCYYCVNNPNCTLGNTSATAACTTCGNDHLGVSISNFAGLGSSNTDKGHGYAKKITDSSGKEVMMFGVFKAIKNNGNITGASSETLSGMAGKIFTVTVEVGVPTEEQYSKVEDTPSKPLGDQDDTFYFRFRDTDEVFHVKDGKAYISGDSSKSVTLPRGKVTKLTIVFDFTGAKSGDNLADSYTVALYDENGCLVNKTNPTLNYINGDISNYSTAYLFQLRTYSKESTGARFLLGDIDVISANPFAN